MFSERMMDAIAVKLGLDALDVRKRNLYGAGRDVTPYGMPVEDNIAPQLIEELETVKRLSQKAKSDRQLQPGRRVPCARASH